MTKIRVILIALFLAGMAISCHAQHTTVTAQVKDANNQLYRNCTGSANFVGQNTVPGSGPYTLGGGAFQTVVPIACDGSGNFTISLADNNIITPIPSQWRFSICSAIGEFPGPPICFNALITITGVSQNVTTNLQSVAALLPTSGSVITLETNGVINGSQSLLNLIQGTNITITDNGVGGVTINSSGGGGGGGTPGAPTNSLQYNNGITFAGTADSNGNIPLNYAASNGQLNPCNIDNVRYASCYNWGPQTPGGSLTGGSPATVTLTPGPRGIDTSASTTWPFYVYVAGTGTPEAVIVTGGTCTYAGAASCTIQFTPVNSHSAGFTVQSATAGHAEAAIDAISTNGGPAHIQTRPAGGPVAVGGNNANNAYNSVFYAPWFVRCSNCVLDGNGGTWALNNLRAVVVIPSINQQHVTIKDVRFMPMITTTHAVITQTSCTTNVATITTTLNPKVGEMVDVMLTNNPTYWGPHIVTTTSPTSWTFAKTCTSIAAETTDGGNDYQMAVIEDNGSGTRIESIDMSFGASPYDKTYNNGVVVLNDQAGMVINGMTTEGHGSCSGGGHYCGSAVYAPGDFGANPAVLNIVNSNLSVGCVMNGVTAYNGNTVAIDNTIIQAYAMWAVNGGTQRGGFGGIKMTNNYNEIGGCTNPMYVPDQAAGVIWYGNTVTELGGEVSQGQIPQFCTGGGTTYYYYLVVHDSGGGLSAPFFMGTGTPSGAACTVTWARAQDINTTTYDVIRTTDGNNAPTTANCPGGSTAACGSRTLAQAQCNGTLQCTFADDVTLNTSAYTVSLPDFQGSGIGGATYSPTFAFWPANFVLQQNAVLNIQGSNVGNSSIAPGGVMATNGIGPIISDGNAPTVGRTYLRLFNLKGPSSGSNMLKLFDPSSSGPVVNAMGRIAILNPVKGTIGHSYSQGSYLITLATPKSDEAIAAVNPRLLAADPNDSGIGLDVGGNNPALYSTGYSSPVGHSFYVGTLLDGGSWKERISANNVEFNSPVQFDQNMLSIAGCTGCGPFTRFPGTTDNFPGTVLSGNWTTLEGSFGITNGLVTPLTFNGAGDQKAYAFYNAVTPGNDAFAIFRGFAGLSGTRSVGVCLRTNSAIPLLGYCARLPNSGSPNLVLSRENGVAGFTSICTIATLPPNGTWLGISAVGSTISLYINGVVACQGTDTTYTSGTVGLVGSNTAQQQAISNLTFYTSGWTDTEGLQLDSLAPKTLVDGATITWNIQSFSLVNATVTLGGNRTLNITNPRTGGNYTLRIVQDGTGGRSLALGTGCTWKVFNGGGGAITLTAAPNSIDIMTFYYDGTNCYANLGSNYN